MDKFDADAVRKNYQTRLALLRESFNRPVVDYNVLRGLYPVRLTELSRLNGWRDLTVVDIQNVMIFVHEFGATVALICSSFDDGAEVVAVASDEPGPMAQASGIGRAVIDDDGDIEKAFNEAIQKAWDDLNAE